MNDIKRFNITTYEITAISLATLVHIREEALPHGFVGVLLCAREVWATLPKARTIGDMARAYAAWRVEELKRLEGDFLAVSRMYVNE